MPASRSRRARIVACAAASAPHRRTRAPTTCARAIPDGIDAVWAHPARQHPSRRRVTRIGNNRGLVVRNVIGATPATGFANAQLDRRAPPGTYIDEIPIDGTLRKDPAWRTGLCDAAERPLALVRHECGTLPNWIEYQIGGFATNALES